MRSAMTAPRWSRAMSQRKPPPPIARAQERGGRLDAVVDGWRRL